MDGSKEGSTTICSPFKYENIFLNNFPLQLINYYGEFTTDLDGQIL